MHTGTVSDGLYVRKYGGGVGGGGGGVGQQVLDYCDKYQGKRRKMADKPAAVQRTGCSKQRRGPYIPTPFTVHCCCCCRRLGTWAHSRIPITDRVSVTYARITTALTAKSPRSAHRHRDWFAFQLCPQARKISSKGTTKSGGANNTHCSRAMDEHPHTSAWIADRKPAPRDEHRKD